MWKTLGVAGVVGVAAGGAMVARRERERRNYTPEQIRERLHARHTELLEIDRAEATTSWLARRRRT